MELTTRRHRRRLIVGIFSWLRLRFFKKPLISILVAIIAVLASVFIHRAVVNALSNAWVQTDWSGGADTGVTADDTNLTTWTQYYSGTNVDHGTTGEIKLQRTLSTP